MLAQGSWRRFSHHTRKDQPRGLVNGLRSSVVAGAGADEVLPDGRLRLASPGDTGLALESEIARQAYSDWRTDRSSIVPPPTRALRHIERTGGGSDLAISPCNAAHMRNLWEEAD